MTLTTHGQLLALNEISFKPDNLLLVAAFPGFNKWQGRTLMIRPTGANLAHILKSWPEAVWDKDSSTYRAEHEEVQRGLDEVAAQKVLDLSLEGDSYVYKTTPWYHQRQAFLLSRDRNNFALLMEQRTGKTKVTLDTAAYLYQRQSIDTLVVVAKNGVHRNWIETEIPKHLPDWCPVAATWNSASMSAKTTAGFEKVVIAQHHLRILAFNVEGFTSKANQYWFERTLAESRAMVVIDESTRIKNQSALRTKYLIKQCRDIPYKRILTGTPVTKGVEDLYAQFLFLDPMLLGFDSFYTFRNRFCEFVTIGKDPRHAYTIVTGYKNIEELYRVLDGCSYRVLRSDCFDIPPKIYKTWPVELTTKQRKVYKELIKEYIVEIEGKTLTAALAITRLIRLQQIACNWFATDDGELLPIETSNPRLNALINDILPEIEGKVIIWARFKADLDAICKALGDKAVSYYGNGASDNARAAGVQKFKFDPSVLYMVANQQSAAWGHDWSVAMTEVFYSNFDDLELRLQAEDRPVKDGQGLLVIDMEAPRTVDRKIIDSLKNKKNVADLITRDPKAFFLEEEMDEPLFTEIL